MCALLALVLLVSSAPQATEAVIGKALNTSLIRNFFTVKVNLNMRCFFNETGLDMSLVLVRADRNGVPLHWSPEIPLQRPKEGRTVFWAPWGPSVGPRVFDIPGICQSAKKTVCTSITHLVFRVHKAEREFLRYDTIEVVTPLGRKFVFRNSEICYCSSFLVPLNDNSLFVACRSAFLGQRISGVDSVVDLVDNFYLNDVPLWKEDGEYQNAADPGITKCIA